MSVVINTNYSATLASNNLASSNASLQKSLNRLSSGTKIVSPADDAGGLAVSMKLSAASKRQGAVSQNIGNATSLLQTQDGDLKVAAKVLDRISELKMLSTDVTKNSSDVANYNSEFKALQAQLTAFGSEKFNGVALFGSTDLTVGTTENNSASSAVTIKAVPLLGTPAFSMVSDNFADLSNWTDLSQPGDSPTVSGNTLHFPAAAGDSRLESNQTVSKALEINFDFNFTDGSNPGNLFVDFNTFITAMDGLDSAVSDTNTHHVRIAYDGAGHFTSFLDGASTPFDTKNLAFSSGNLEIGQQGGTATDVRNFSITSTSTSTASPSNVSTVASAADLGALNLSTVTSAIQDVATYRAQNGATQSRLGFADELLTTNKTNLEAANSRIIDVDVASESTQLARFNTLVQAGTSMLAQANQSAQTALKLLQ